jgi:uncharacterized protein YkwD
MRRGAALLVGSLLIGLLISSTPSIARTSTQVLRMVSLTNQARQQARLAGLRLTSDLNYVARRHALEMAQQQRLYHNPTLRSDVRYWNILGENVGTGHTMDFIFNGWMESSSHRRHIYIRQYRDIGVGVVRDSLGRYWVDVVYRG